MSRDKGSKNKGAKNQKKAPADKSSGIAKPISSYKSEGKSEIKVKTTSEDTAPKSDSKSVSSPKK
jgi:hypothetical protein